LQNQQKGELNLETSSTNGFDLMERDLFLNNIGGKPWRNYNFSTWQGFGFLWGWSQGQGWWEDFLYYMEDGYLRCNCPTIMLWLAPNFIHPDLFADAVYQFLKERSYETKY
jgi:hypothetical protein